MNNLNNVLKARDILFNSFKSKRNDAKKEIDKKSQKLAELNSQIENLNLTISLLENKLSKTNNDVETNKKLQKNKALLEKTIADKENLIKEISQIYNDYGFIE